MPSIFKQFFGAKGERYLGKAGVGPKSYLKNNPEGIAPPVGRLQQKLQNYRRLGQREVRLQGILADQQQPFAQAYYQKQLADAQARKAQLGGALQQRQQNITDRITRGVDTKGQYNRLLKRQARIEAGLAPLTPPPPPIAPTPDIPVPGEDETVVPGAPMSLQDLLKQYEAPASAVEGPYQNFLTSGLSRLNAIPQPSYNDMFNRWLDVSNREAGRQSAAISEALGARGARYGQDILNAQTDLRQRQTQDIATKADEVGRLLNEQRIGETQGNVNAALGFGQLEAQRKNQAMSLLFADFLRRTAPPPLLQAGSQYGSGAGFGDAIVGG